jgi:hypothetical protein
MGAGETRNASGLDIFRETGRSRDFQSVGLEAVDVETDGGADFFFTASTLAPVATQPGKSGTEAE